MNKKKWSLITVSIIALFFISSYVYGLIIFRVGDRDFSLPKDAEVTSVQIVPPDNEDIILTKDIQGQWWVGENYHANEYAINDLLSILRHFTVRQPVSKTERKEINNKLERDGILINVFFETYLFNFFDVFGFIETERKYNSFLVGDNVKKIDGTYMRMSGSETPHILYLPGYSGGIASVFTPEKHVWFDPIVVDLSAKEIDWVKIVSNENPEESFILKTDKGLEFYDLDSNLISNGFQFDTAKVVRFLSSFSDLYFETFLKDDAYIESEELIFPEYAYRVVVADLEQNEYSFDVYRRYRKVDFAEQYELSPVFDPDRFYLELENGYRAVAQYYVFGRILRSLSFFEA